MSFRTVLKTIKPALSRANVLGWVLLLFALAIACSIIPPAPTPTPEPTSTPVPPTQTPLPPTNTPTPEPTETPTLIPTDTPTETPTPTDTPTATPDLAATAAYESTQAAEAALEKVGKVLAKVNLAQDSGYLAWADEGPIPVISDDYGTMTYIPIDDGVVYETYVLHVDITWDSTGGFAGCGIIFHAEDNLEFGKQYQFFVIRLSGLPAWDVELWNYGDWQSTVTGRVKVNSAINQENRSTNNYVLVVKKGVTSIYANDTRLSNVIISLGEGRIAFYAAQESGETICVFENAWVWVLEE
ncbi:MAG: hypothetical protein ACE5GO_10970, partial [Anaerolineales bacterium]